MEMARSRHPFNCLGPSSCPGNVYPYLERLDWVMENHILPVTAG